MSSTPVAAGTLDFHHPLFLHPSDTSRLTLIGIKLIGPENYTLWSKSMRLALLGKNKQGFIDGTCTKNQISGSLAVLWKRCNAIVLSWIGATVSPELVSSIVYASDSKIVWDEFKERFDKSNLTRIYQLWKDNASLTQGTSSVMIYFSKMKDYWDEINALVPAATCNCETSRPSIELLRNQQLLQFLMGLNESFSHVISEILLNTHLLTVNQAYTLVIQEESQRGLGVIDGSRNSIIMMVGRDQKLSDNSSNQRFSAALSIHQQQKYQNYKPRKPPVPFGTICDHCKYKGHFKKDCYRLVGYPPDFQSKRRPGPTCAPPKPYATSNAVEVERSNDMKNQERYISEEHYQELLVQENKASSSGDFQAHMAGILTLLSNIFFQIHG